MSSFAETPGAHLQRLILDPSAAVDHKVACLKTLRVVVKNLADRRRNGESRYRQLKLSNAKVRARLAPCPSASDYLKALGFAAGVDEDGGEYLRIDPSATVSVLHMEASLAELDNAIQMLAPRDRSFSEEKKTPEGIIIRESVSGGYRSTGKMSEKQKARLLMEKKRLREIQEAKEARKKTSDLIKQDKYVRENDENWTSKQSAACVKSGTGISTFRDKYGES